MKIPYLAKYAEKQVGLFLNSEESTMITKAIESSDPDSFGTLSCGTDKTAQIEESDPDEFPINIVSLQETAIATSHTRTIETSDSDSIVPN